jgi:LuxR family maltose regulon positive regulatory protein
METKLRPPPLRPGCVPRRALVARLQASAARLVLLSAPAGYGKTTLLAEWYAIEGSARPIAWLSLDGGDEDPVRFWTFVVESLRRVLPRFGTRVLAALRAHGADPGEAALPRLINELQALPGSVWVVLDDYHRIHERRCHELLASFIERLPANTRLVLATRQDPPLPLGRFRARGELVEVRTADLRFAEADAGALLAASLGEELARDEVALLAERTEGWAAGLYLAAVSLRDRPDRAAFLRRFEGSHRYIAEYLTGEVLELQEPAVRRLLARTSILERFCAPLCDQVAGCEGSAELLARLEQADLFVIPLDESRVWYRYHHLFADLLRSELGRSESRMVPELHRRAREWHREQGNAEEAIHHALAGKEWPVAGELIAEHWFPFLNRGQLATVRRWLGQMSPETLATDPVAALAAGGVAALSGDREAAAGHLAVAERGVHQGVVPGGFVSLESGVAIFRAIGFEGLGVQLAAARRAVELEADPTSPWRAAALFLLGVGRHLHGDLTAARQTLEAAVEAARRGPRVIRIDALSVLSLVADEQGRRDEADALAKEAIRLVEDRDLAETPQVAFAYAALGQAMAHRGRLAEADAALAHGLRLRRAHAGLSSWGTIPLLLVFAPVRHALGDGEGARTLLDEARAIAGGDPDAGYLRGRIARCAEAMDHGRRRFILAGEPLSEAELAVLRLLPTALSRRDIGQQLFLSLNTVKSHTRALYRKLGAASRSEAVQRAKQEGLL